LRRDDRPRIHVDPDADIINNADRACKSLLPLPISPSCGRLRATIHGAGLSR
jgi:hypothetical protein